MRRLVFVALVLCFALPVACGETSTRDDTDGGDSGPTPRREGGSYPENDAEPGVDARRDVGTFDAGVTDADDWTDAGTCNTVVGTGPFVEITRVAAPLPLHTGGVIDPGAYDLTSIVEYTGADGGTGGTGEIYSQTWLFTPDADGGFVVDRALASVADGGVHWMRTRETLTTRPPHIATMTSVCPSTINIISDVPYTATGTGPGALFKTTYSAPRIYTFLKR